MPGKTVKITGEKEAVKKLKDIRDNSLRVRTIVSAAKASGDSVFRDMKANMSSAIDRGSDLTKLLGKKKIPVSFGGREWPGAWIGPKSKKKFTIPGSGGAISIFWVEFGTTERTQESTGRDTGRFPAKAPLRNAIKSNYNRARATFVGLLIDRINRRIKKNQI